MRHPLEALNERYAVKVFDSSKNVSAEDLHTILESGRLSPSSFGTEPWHFIVVENPDLRKQLRAVSFDQEKVTDAPHIIVICARTDVREAIPSELIARTASTQGVTEADLAGLRGMVEGSMLEKTDEELRSWAKAQTYLPLGIMIETAAMLGIDSGPMEGFDAVKVDDLLGLTKQHLTATTMLAIGYRGDDPAAKRPKVRRSFEEVVTFIK